MSVLGSLKENVEGERSSLNRGDAEELDLEYHEDSRRMIASTRDCVQLLFEIGLFRD